MELSAATNTVSTEAEAEVLGCLLLEPELVDEAISALTPEDFRELKNQNIFRLLLELRQEGKPIAVQTVLQEAKNLDGNYNMVGGAAWVADLPNRVPSSALLPYSISIVQQKAKLRELQQAAHSVLNLVRDAGRSDEERIEEASSLLTQLLHDSGSAGETNIKDTVHKAIDQIEAAFTHKGECTGVPTGFLALDRQTAGFQAGDMIVLAARPSMGKTSLALNIAEHVALDKGIPVGFLSLEMSDVSLVKRIFSSRSSINGHNIMNGQLTDRDIAGITSVAGNVARSPLHINAKPGLGIMEMASIARRMVLKHGCKLIIIDYLQLMQAKAESRVQEVSKISAAIKGVAKELNVPVLVLSQLSRGVDSRDSGIPRLADLRDSGAIEQDADLVLFLSRDVDTTITRLDVAKHRSGPTGIVELEWDAAHTKYTNPVYWMQNDAQSDAA